MFYFNRSYLVYSKLQSFGMWYLSYLFIYFLLFASYASCSASNTLEGGRKKWFFFFKNFNNFFFFFYLLDLINFAVWVIYNFYFIWINFFQKILNPPAAYCASLYEFKYYEGALRSWYIILIYYFSWVQIPEWIYKLKVTIKECAFCWNYKFYL